MEFPRRINIDKMTPAEKAIHDATQAVEAMPADERLTRAVVLLQSAREYVADFVDGVPLNDQDYTAWGEDTPATGAEGGEDGDE